MDNNNLLLGVDELTLVILPEQNMEILVWEEYAQTIIYNFLAVTELETVLDNFLQESDVKKLSGYDKNYNLGITDYYFNIAYNTCNPSMGVCIKFSAKAWAIFQAQYQKKFDIQLLFPEFFKIIASNTADLVRLSRIDLTADYFNYNLDLSELNKKISVGDILVQDDNGRTRIKNHEAYSKNNHVETIYIGSRKKNTNGFLRIYNKKTEQLENNGFRIDEALKNHSWIRFEAVFKGKYSQSIAETLLQSSMNSIQFTQYIAQLITQKYRFFSLVNESYTDFTKDLINIANDCTYDRLRSESPRDNALKQNIQHILHGSGLFPTFYKIEKLYGKESVSDFLNYLMLYYTTNAWMSTTMYKELRIWLKKHAYLKNVPLGYSIDKLE